MESLLKLAGLDWPVPDFSTLSRRQKGLNVAIPYRPGTGALHLLIDSEPVSATGSSEPARGIKSEGEGEWFRPRNTGLPSLGSGARSIWGLMRIRLKSGRLRSPVAGLVMSSRRTPPVQENRRGMLPELLRQIPADQPIDKVSADGAYDTRASHAAPVMPQLQTATLVPSFPRARTLDRGARTHPARGPETTPSARHAALVAQSGGGGAAIIDEASSRQKCAASSCSVSVSWLATSTGRWPNSRSRPRS